jgi:lysophospholipid acyltransferase (LPLAT)-like uncharacterized protein
MIRRFRRWLLRTRVMIALVAWIAYLAMEFVYWTNRWQVIGGSDIRNRWDHGQPTIVTFWHNRLFMMCRCWRQGIPASMLISHHRDGKLIAKTIGHYNVGTIAGSTSRGSTQALRGLIEATKRGTSIGITPDGPRGPRYHVAAGAVYLAKVTGLPIVPVVVATTKRKMLRSWDRFLVNLPFGRGVYIWGKSISVPADADAAALEQARLLLEREMRIIADQADMLCGHAPIPVAETNS